MKDEGHSVRDLRQRTKAFALSVIKLYVALPKSTEAQILGKQLLRAGTSVGAHYREGQRAKSDADLISKLEGALQELEETGYWLELLTDANIVSINETQPLQVEAEQLIAIFVTAVKRVKNHEAGR